MRARAGSDSMYSRYVECSLVQLSVKTFAAEPRTLSISRRSLTDFFLNLLDDGGGEGGKRVPRNHATKPATVREFITCSSQHFKYIYIARARASLEKIFDATTIWKTQIKRQS